MILSVSPFLSIGLARESLDVAALLQYYYIASFIYSRIKVSVKCWIFNAIREILCLIVSHVINEKLGGV